MHQTLEEGGPEKDLAVGVSCQVFFGFVSRVFVGGSLGHLVCFWWLFGPSCLFSVALVFFPWLFGPSCFFGGSLGHLGILL